MGSFSRAFWLWIATVFFFGGWQSTVAPDWAGSPIWNLAMAGLFWLGAALASAETLRVAREAISRFLQARQADSPRSTV